MWVLKLTGITYEAPPGSMTTPTSLVLHFPLLLEDPFAGRRREMLAEDLLLGVSPSVTSHPGAPPDGPLSTCQSAIGSYTSEEGPRSDTSVLATTIPILPNIHRKEWCEVVREGMRCKGLVLPEVRERSTAQKEGYQKEDDGGRSWTSLYLYTSLACVSYQSPLALALFPRCLVMP